MKRVALLGLTLGILLTGSISFADSRFSDIPDGAWYSKAILSQDVMQGSDGKFRPLDGVTRAELAVIITKLLNRIDGLEKEIGVLKTEKYAISDEQRVLNSIEKNKPSVVQINSGTISTGFYVTPNLILTAAHTVDKSKDGKPIRITISGKPDTTGMVVARDEARDMLLIETETEGIPVTMNSDLTVGQTVLVIGNPLGHTNSVTKGIVSGLNRIYGGYVTQIDAAVNKGNSGGILINLEGEVVGMIRAKVAFEGKDAMPVERIAYALRVQELTEFIEEYTSIQ